MGILDQRSNRETHVLFSLEKSRSTILLIFLKILISEIYLIVKWGILDQRSNREPTFFSPWKKSRSTILLIFLKNPNF